LKGFSPNCKKLISSLEEDYFPDVEIFRPLNMTLTLPLIGDHDHHYLYQEKKYCLPYKGGVYAVFNNNFHQHSDIIRFEEHPE
jgi:hypothetical protein